MSRVGSKNLVSVCLAILMVSSALIFLMPTARATTWYQGTDTDFSGGSLWNVEIVGSGEAASIQLTKNYETWVNKSPAYSPSAREGPSMAYDSDDGIILLFGGYNGTYLNDTWTYDASTNTWTNLNLTSAPPVRELGGMAYDTLNHIFVLYGGVGAGLLSDTWEFDYSTKVWNETSPPISPAGLTSCPLTFDESIGKFVLAGEHTGFETWTYDANTNVWFQVTPSPSPPARGSHALVYDASINRTILYGGVTSSFVEMNDTWEYNGTANEWTEVTTAMTPPPMHNHAMTYRTWDGKVVLFGGENLTAGYFSDTWMYFYEAGVPTWSLSFYNTPPPARSMLGMAYDGGNNKTVVFGGNSFSGYRGDTWSLENAYQGQGVFVSSRYDSLSGDTNWQYVWWNDTTQPGNTTLRFQIATSNSSSGPWVYWGPACNEGSYYTVPGTSICTSQAGRYAKYRAELFSWNNLNTPVFDNITIVFNVPPLPPKMMATDPAHLDMGVDWWKNITVYFSEPMNTSSVTYTISPSISLTPQWDPTESILYLNHSTPLQESKWYQVEITGGMDKDGNPIDWGNSSQNPWNFLTKTVKPWVQETVPANLQENVPLSYPIWINFSEPMNTTTVSWAITPNPGGWSEIWQNSNKTLYLTHTNNYTQCTWHQVNVSGEDLAGNPLQSGPVPNPWQFKSECLNPYIVSTDPQNNAIDIDLSFPINITFSEEINTTTFQWNITPGGGLGWTEAWGGGNTYVVLSHVSNFSQCTLYHVNVIEAKDLDNNSLMSGPVPNPFQFKTVCINPFIVSTDPADNETNVPIDKDIVVAFSETIDNTTFQWNIDPLVSGWSEKWSPFNDMVTLSHTELFHQCTYYTVNVTRANDTDGNPLVGGLVPNPWTFNTTCANPVIVATDPVNGTSNVDLNKDIIINFSKAMNRTITWGIIPDENFTWSESWTNGDMTLTLSHVQPFSPITTYHVAIISAQDKSGNPLKPGPVPNPFEFTTRAGGEPYITQTDPYSGETNVSLNRSIVITFSEEIVPLSVVWSISPDPNPGSWIEGWNANHTVLTLQHPVNFSECKIYTVNVSDAMDLDGMHLIDGPVPNPWGFATICVSPYIWYTYPQNNATDIPLNADVIVNFSEPMDTATVTWNFNPPVGKTPTWLNGNKTLKLSPPVTFTECQPYMVTITGKDMDGNGLVGGTVPNPWNFTTTCLAPYIVSTIPANNQTGVALDANITINFSEEMDTGTVVWTITPLVPGGWNEIWSNGNSTLTLEHLGLFAENTQYMVWVTDGKDLDGLGLVPGPVPNPWNFTTGIFSPYIIFTNPADGDTSVNLNANITIKFSEAMNNTTVTWTITPDPGGWSEIWSNGSQTLTLVHSNPFTALTNYTVNVTGGKDLDGFDLIPGPVPNPWTFTTGTGVAVSPWITVTTPADGAVGVLLDAPIIINFSEPMNTTTVNWTITPDGSLGWSGNWTNGDQTLTLTHSTLFTENTTYMVWVTGGQDLDGNPLVAGPVPNPWNFTTMWDVPFITNTIPSDGDTGVDYYANIVVNFSEPIDVASFSYSVTPNPGGWHAPQWSNSNMTVVLVHDNPFYECTLTTVKVNATDRSGIPLGAGPAPNPWAFTVICENPWIVSTDPFDGQGGVAFDAKVTVVFSEAMNKTSVLWTFVPDPGGWIPVWSNDSKTLILDHSNPFDYCQAYNVTISGTDLAGLPLVAGPVSNPWVFTTLCELKPPAGLQILRQFPSDVNLTWSSVANATEYHIYESRDKFAPFPWPLLGMTTQTWYVASGHLDDNLTHYYIVRAYNLALGKESGNSTMAVKISKDFSINPVLSSIYWMSLPYNSEYKKASDIVNELDGNIDVVGKWDRSRQRTVVYFYARGKWRGTDFPINAGDGIYVGAKRAFTWYIVGTDSSVSLNFSFSPQATKTNRHWFSLPYTGNYRTASDIVRDIEGGLGVPSKIVEVGKWDPLSQGIIKYRYKGGWTGVDFNIEPGDGIYIKVLRSFDWQPKLITPEVP